MIAAKLDRQPPERRLAQGAELAPGGTHFRVWAPHRRKVEVVVGGSVHALRAEASGGHWSVLVEGIGAGARYRYRLDGEGAGFPDPASRYLPDGPHGESEVVDPRAYEWKDRSWAGMPRDGQIVYELHVGTFTDEGTWRAAAGKLATLRELGVTVIEVMPVAEFPGRFGWGYDGVGWFAPTRLYGAPDDLRAFVDEAHRLELGVILDVVYNHFGPDGNYLDQFSPYYCGREANEWGRGLNFDGEQATAVRRFVTDNAAYWIDEFHLDGLRLDATQSLVDRSDEHIIAALARAARAVAGDRRLLIVAENEPQDANLLRAPERGGGGIDGVWNDDFHHSSVVAVTGRRQAYFSDYHGTANEWLAAAKHGFLFQGQRSAWQKKRRGHMALGLPSRVFVAFLENHDQVANSYWSARLWQDSSPGCFRAMTALLCLGPWMPMLFQGQEWNASSPFHYFADHTPELSELVRKGRAEFMSQFPGCAARAGSETAPHPGFDQLFAASRLRWDERARPVHERALRLHGDLLALRRGDATLRAHQAGGATLEVAALTPACGLLRYVAGETSGAVGDRLLVVNLGPDLDLESPVEPLLAPPTESGSRRWQLLWSSEDPRYGGNGSADPESEGKGWRLPGFAAVWLGPEPPTAAVDI